jgi:hypothetical protein
MTLDLLTYDDFAPQLDQIFKLAGPEHTETPLTLVEAEPGRPRADARTPFTLVFRSATAQVLPQQLYTLDNAAMGRLEIFLVPLREAAGGIDYAATFN